MKLHFQLMSMALLSSIGITQAFASYPSDISPYSTSFVYQQQPYDASIAKPLIPKQQNFTGYYLGLSGVESFFHYDVDANPQNAQFNKNQGGLSLFFGYGYEFNTGIYLGGQLSGIYYPASNVNSSGFGYNNVGNTAYYTGIAPIASINLDFNPGYEVINHLLVYGIIGTGVEIYRYNYVYTSNGNSSDIINDSADKSITFRFGAGVKYQLSSNVLVNFDYVVAKGTSMDSSGWLGSNNLSQSISPMDQTFELGIAYKF